MSKITKNKFKKSAFLALFIIFLLLKPSFSITYNDAQKNTTAVRKMMDISVNGSKKQKIIVYNLQDRVYIRQDEFLNLIGLEKYDDEEDTVYEADLPLEFDANIRPYEAKKLNVKLKQLDEKILKNGYSSRLYPFKGFEISYRKNGEEKIKNSQYVPLAYSLEKVSISNLIENHEKNSKKPEYSIKYDSGKNLIKISTDRDVNFTSQSHIVPAKNKKQVYAKNKKQGIKKSSKNLNTDDQIKRDFLNILNKQRKNLGLKEFSYSENLNNLAEARTRTMIKNKTLSHCQNGKYACDMAKSYGYPTNMVGENILYTNRKRTGQNIYNIWNKSKRHKALMLTNDARYREIGLCVLKSDRENLYYATLLIGQPE